MFKKFSKKGQRLFALLLAVAMMFSVMPMNAIAVTSTNVNEDGYIEVRTIGDLYNIRDDLTANYILMNDIDLTIATAQGGDWDYGGRGWNPIGSNDVYGDGEFSGIFDGNGYSIIGMRIEYTSSTKPSGMGDNGYVGLFSKVTGEVCNLSMKNVNIMGGWAKSYLYTGAIAASNRGTITDCSVTGIITGGDTGEHCMTGGIAGYNVDGTISKCYNAATVKNTGWDDWHYAGGICAYGGNVLNCYNIGVATSYNSGGICTRGTSVTNCYNIGAAGYAIAGGSQITINDSYYLTNTGKGYTGATELTAGQTKLQSSYRNFDFENVWVLDTDAIYPYPQLRDNPQDIRVISNVSITPPAKTLYYLNEVLDLTGCVVEFEFENAENELINVTADMVTGFDATKLGEQELTVTYYDREITFTVNVLELPYNEIWTIEDLYNIRNDLTGNYILMNDIDLTEATAEGGDYDYLGTGWKPIGDTSNAFSGKFNGNGFSIMGLRIDTGDYAVGLFAKVSGEVVKLSLKNVNIDGGWYQSYSGGGIAAINNGLIDNCSITGTVKQGYSVGGITGVNNGTISNCYNNATITKNNFYEGFAGGIAGKNTGIILNCYNVKDVYNDANRREATAGGIAGTNNGTSTKTAQIIGCYNLGVVECYYDNSKYNAYAIAQKASYGSCTSSYYLVNTGDNTDGALSLSDLQMRTQSMFADFDFDNIWILNPYANHPYPQLRSNIQDLNESVEAIRIISTPEKKEYLTEDVIDLTDGVIEAVYVSGKTELINITEDMITGFDSSVTGEQTITVAYGGQTATFTVNVSQRPAVTGIEITSEPDKKEFLVGESFDFTGAQVKISYEDNTSVIRNVTVDMATGANNNELGEQTVYVTLYGFTDSFKITVSELTLVSLNIETLPNKLVYLEGEALDTTGLSLYAKFNDGRTVAVTNGYAVSGYSEEAGTHTITVKYLKLTTSFEVEVTARKVTSLELRQMPDKMEYYEGDEFDKTGIILVALFDNNELEIIEDYEIVGYDSTAGTKTVSITYGGHKVSFTVQVYVRAITNLYIWQYPTKTNYIENESLDTTGLIVKADYNDGNTKTVTDYELVGFSSNPGTHTITIAFEGTTTSYDIYVTEKTLQDVRITLPTKQTYEIGEEFNPDGMVVKAYYDNGQEFVIDDYQMTGFDSAVPGAKTITVTYGGISRSFAVAVQERSVIETGGNMIVGNLVGRLGETVVIPVSVTRNTGIAGFTHTIKFDATALKLVSVDAVGGYADGTVILNDEKIANGDLTILWFGGADVKGDGVVYNLTFKILETAKDGNAEITISFDDNDNGNISGENVIFGTMNGFVEVRSYWLGDLDGNRKYAMVDLLQLAQYVSGKEMTLTEKQKLSADVNEDGFIDIHDVIMLNQWLLVADM